MAQYFEDGSSLANFTEEGLAAGTDFTVSGGEFLSSTGGGDALSHDDASADANRANFEILTRYKQSAFSSAHMLCIGRGAFSNTGYVVTIRSNAIRTNYRTSLTGFTQIASVAKTHTAGTYYWIRFRVNGSDVRVKIWPGAIGDEPTTGGAGDGWDAISTDTTYSAAGFVGLNANTAGTPTQTWDQIGIGTNGDAAPSAAAGGTPTITALTPTSLNKPRFSLTF